MTVHQARIIALAAVLVGISALVPSTRLHAQQPVSELPPDELRKLAEQGHADAQFNLGQLFYVGQEGLLQDFVEAARWYRLAADQGHADAQESLGFMYQLGIFVRKDTTEAARWYRLAADQGHANAQLQRALDVLPDRQPVGVVGSAVKASGSTLSATSRSRVVSVAR